MGARPYILIPNPGFWRATGAPDQGTTHPGARHAICKASFARGILQRQAPEPFSALSVVAAQPSSTMG